MAEKLYMQTDDRVKIGDKPMKHTDSKGQELHDRHVKNRKELLKQYNYAKALKEEFDEKINNFMKVVLNDGK